jgi:hypothetical protein
MERATFRARRGPAGWGAVICDRGPRIRGREMRRVLVICAGWMHAQDADASHVLDESDVLRLFEKLKLPICARSQARPRSGLFWAFHSDAINPDQTDGAVGAFDSCTARMAPERSGAALIVRGLYFQ